MTIDLVFLAGILSFFSPCTLPLLPVYLADLAGGVTTFTVQGERRKVFEINVVAVARTLVFVCGISTSFVLMGFGAGLVGQVLGGQGFLMGCGLLAIVLGLHQMGLFRLPILEKQRALSPKGWPRSGMFGTFLLGFTFSFGWTPCVGPVLATVLALASNQGPASSAAFMMLFYSAGLALPFILISLLGAWAMDRIKVVQRHLPKIQVVSGLLIVIMGVLLMTNNLNILSINF